eukprot:3333234-Karenia_brevis.AAC.1
MPDNTYKLWTVLADTVESALPRIRVDNVGSLESEAVGLVYAIMYVAGLGVLCPVHMHADNIVSIGSAQGTMKSGAHHDLFRLLRA